MCLLNLLLLVQQMNALDDVCCIAGSTVLCFHYEAISPNTVQIPARLVHTQRAPEHTWLHREVDDLTKVCYFNTKTQQP